VYLPDTYYSIIRDAKTTEKFDILKMEHNFYEFKNLPAQLGLA
jgi:hypothetical protein